MFRRRFGRRRFQRRRPYAKRKVFGKRATRAIKAISQRPVETKWQIWNSDLLVDIPISSWPAVASQSVFIRNVLQTIPRSNNATWESRSEVIGQEFILRGIKIKGIFSYTDSLTASNPQALRIRVSLVQLTDYIDQSTFGPYSTAGDVFEDDDSMPVTVKKFNMDRVKVLKSKVVTQGVTSNRPYGVVNIWWKTNRKVKCYYDEGTVATNLTVGRVMGWQYYIIVEILNTVGYSWEVPSDRMYMSTQVYFKDA